MGHCVSIEDVSYFTVTPILPTLAVFYSQQYTNLSDKGPNS